MELWTAFWPRTAGCSKVPTFPFSSRFSRVKRGLDYFQDIPLTFFPYLHQEQAFVRLCDPKPRSTIVATGTGSGKTECFLLPILDHCLRHRGEPGIKAILIYPMNALATDQAKRIARTIYDNPHLRGNVTAGLYVGQKENEPQRVMSREGIITNKDTLRLKPPDILLTNYKMLHYLLIRPWDLPLWQNNHPETLRFLVVDELHTFDGAQGTDLACLVRRLKARLGTPDKHLCCVGTSATLGTSEETDALLDYARQVFGESFEKDAVIHETRINAGEFLDKSPITRIALPSLDRAADLDPESHDDYRQYAVAQHALWFETDIQPETFETTGWRTQLADHLKGHLFFQNLLKILGGRIRETKEITDELARVTPGLRNADPEYTGKLLDSLLTLVSMALAERGDGGTAPFLNEYGFNARIGRTLEKTGSSVAHVDPEPMEAMAGRMRTCLRNEIGGLRNLDAHTLKAFLSGFVAHMKDQGAILHEALGEYMEGWGNTFLLKKIPWMPKFGPKTRAPAFLTTARRYRFDQLFNATSNRRTWYEAWLIKCLSPINPFIPFLTRDLYELILKEMVSAGVLAARQQRNETLWGIRPEALRVSEHVVQFRCDRCSHTASVAASEKALWEGAPCLRFNCDGYYREEPLKIDYYAKLYAGGDVNRIFSEEHTGMLTREDREALEKRFQAVDRQPWDPNLLSCTPTLELGIDIGDLSTIILCSIPPAQANYFQRIGSSDTDTAEQRTIFERLLLAQDQLNTPNRPDFHMPLAIGSKGQCILRGDMQ
jgi:hypothetical protein